MHMLKFLINFEMQRNGFAKDLIKSKIRKEIRFILVLEQKVKTHAYVLMFGSFFLWEPVRYDRNC